MSPSPSSKIRGLSELQVSGSIPAASVVEESPVDYVARLNKSVTSMFTKTLNKNPNADLGPIFTKYNAEYASRRSKAEAKSEEKRKQSKGKQSKTPDPNDIKPGNSAVNNPIPSTQNPSFETFTSVASVCTKSRQLKQALHIPAEQTIQILRTPSSRLDEVLGSPPSHDIIRRSLNHSAHTIHSLFDIHVLKVAQNFVVKIRPSNFQGSPAENEQDVLTYLRSRLPDLLIPEPLGLLKIGDTCYSFMSYVPRQDASAAWSQLTPARKDRLKCDLTSQLEKLRALSNDTGGFGFNDVCVDMRLHENITHTRITNTAGFNDFLLRNPLITVADEYVAFLKERVLSQDGQDISGPGLVFAHGDLHPRNILIDDDGSITGIVDWENAGWYPRYWECAKALNTICFSKSGDINDWWRVLPEDVMEGFAGGCDGWAGLGCGLYRRGGNETRMRATTACRRLSEIKGEKLGE